MLFFDLAPQQILLVEKHNQARISKKPATISSEF